jgi:hypothetical protein
LKLREAWFYEEMEYLQGVAIARCYGFFTLEIDPNSEVLDWAVSDADYYDGIDIRDEDSQSPDDYDEEVDVRDEDSQSSDGYDSGNGWDPKQFAEMRVGAPLLYMALMHIFDDKR